MASTVSTTFPDSTYTSSSKPSAVTLQTDISAIETALNANAASMTENTDSNIKTNTWVVDEDTLTSDLDTKVPTQQSVKAYVDAAIVAAKAALYPVGAIYTNITGTNPGTELGFGTWTAFGSGRTLVGLAAGDEDFDTAEETGGAKTSSVAHTHTGPSHTHTGTTGGSSAQVNVDIGSGTDPANRTHTHTITTDAGGTGNTGAMSANATPSVVQPYIVVHMWKRTV